MSFNYFIVRYINRDNMKLLFVILLLMAATVSSSPQQKNDAPEEVYYTKWEPHIKLSTIKTLALNHFYKTFHYYGS